MSVEERVKKVEEELERIKKQLRKHAAKRKTSLTDKFAMHDHAQSLVRWFEEMENELHSTLKPEHYKDLKEIIKNFSNLVDNALGTVP
ncbi:unnamed protein product [marine sediment metagenome]|uniref:Uncharacterized protein n=1 Tax=marine sediment metagenome TaxID=412755 RepID=X1KTU6_9ZZZZ